MSCFKTEQRGANWPGTLWIPSSRVHSALSRSLTCSFSSCLSDQSIDAISGLCFRYLTLNMSPESLALWLHLPKVHKDATTSHLDGSDKCLALILTVCSLIISEVAKASADFVRSCKLGTPQRGGGTGIGLIKRMTTQPHRSVSSKLLPSSL